MEPNQSTPQIDLPTPNPNAPVSETQENSSSTASTETAAFPAPVIEPGVDATPKTTVSIASEIPQPATLPLEVTEHTAGKPLLVGIFAIILLVLITASTFLYIQNQGLQQQLATLQSIESSRQILSPTPTAAAETAITPETIATPSGGVFTNLESVLAKARTESPTAQLLMVTAEITVPSTSVAEANSATAQYWFRRAPGEKDYFQVIVLPGSQPEVSKPATVSPDTNTPDLIAQYSAQSLGLDIFEANQLAWNTVNSVAAGSTPAKIEAKYIRVPAEGDSINVWQVTYKFAEGAGISDLVVQINANTQQVIFTNLPEPTPTPAAINSPS